MQKPTQKIDVYQERFMSTKQNETKKSQIHFSYVEFGGKLNKRQPIFFLFISNGRNGAKCTLKFSVLGHLKCLGLHFLSVHKNPSASAQLHSRIFAKEILLFSTHIICLHTHTPANVINDMTMVTSITSATMQ